jgi:cephalosporin hydroxylase
MYHYRYNWNDKTVRPFKVISIDISLEPKANIERYPLLSSYITFIHDSSSSDKAKTMVNDIYKEMKAKNVFISLDGDHKARSVYNELVYYQQFLSNIGNYILAQDTRLSKKWFPDYCSESVFDGPCNGPEEAVQWFLKNEGKERFVIDPTQEYLFTTNHNGWIKRIAL